VHAHDAAKKNQGREAFRTRHDCARGELIHEPKPQSHPRNMMAPAKHSHPRNLNTNAPATHHAHTLVASESLYSLPLHHAHFDWHS
jgi:hypothetical protein